MTDDAIHMSEGNDTDREGYAYAMTGVGVRVDLVAAVLEAWSALDPQGDPAGPLRYVNQGALNTVENLARVAAAAVAQKLTPPIE